MTQRESLQKPINVLGYKINVSKKGSAPHCWKTQACNLNIDLVRHRYFSNVKIINWGLQHQWKITSAERMYRICLPQQHSRRKSGKLHSCFWEAIAYTVSVLHLELFPRPAAVWSGTQKAHEQVKVPETDLEHHPALFWKKTHLCTLGSPCNVYSRMGNKCGQKISCKAGSCSGLHHCFRHSPRDWYWCSWFWRRGERTLDANLVEKPIEGAGVRYKMWKQEWMWWYKIQPP